MGDKDKRSAFTTVVISDIENNTQEVLYNSYTLPLLFHDGNDMSKFIEKIEAVPDHGVTLQNDIVFYDNTFESVEDTFGYVLITLNNGEESVTLTLAELIAGGMTITPFISDDGGGGESSDFSTAKVTLINSTADNNHISLSVPCILSEEEIDVAAGFGDPGSENNIDVVIYKSTPTYAFTNIIGLTATATGGVRIISTAGGAFTFEITGDGSITVDEV